MVAVGTLALLFYPEAPRYLIKTERLDEAVKVLRSIANSNGVSEKHLDLSCIQSMMDDRDDNEPVTQIAYL